MSLSRRLDLPEDDRALVVLQDDQPVTAGQIRSQSQKLAAELQVVRASRVLLPTDRADHLVIGLLACRAARCDLVLHRGPTVVDELIAAMGVDTILMPDLTAVPNGAPIIARDDQTKVVLMTSGTTGLPKAASHDLERLAGLIPEERPAAAIRWLLTYHPASFAGFQVVLTALLARAPVAARSSPGVAALCETAKTFGSTSISGTPTFWRAFLMTLAGEESKVPLRHATLGGEAVDQAILDRLHAHFPSARITHIYASTEAGAVFAVKDGRAGFPSAWLTGKQIGVGMRIVEGVLQVQSPRRMAGYVSDHASPVDKQGWLDTGDLVKIAGDRVFFEGRRDDIINVGGQKVRPEEVEALIRRIAGVMDVHVKGIANPLTGQLVGADIVAPGMDEAQVREKVKAICKDLPAYASPRIVRIIAELQTTQSGKKSRS
jgi:acyl-CoA synthetase (AMP-forming)/AMP-acid ligase II